MYVYLKMMFHIQSLRDAYNNFNSYLAILSAIESSAISRLEWPEKVIKVSVVLLGLIDLLLICVH